MILFDTTKRHQKVVNDVIWFFFVYYCHLWTHSAQKTRIFLLDLHTYLSAWHKSVGKILFNKNWQKTTVPFLCNYAKFSGGRQKLAETFWQKQKSVGSATGVYNPLRYILRTKAKKRTGKYHYDLQFFTGYFERD